MDDVSEQIKHYILTDIASDLNITHLEDDEPLIESGIIDSLGVLKILAFLEESLGLDLSSDQVKMENFKSIRTIRAMVERQKGNC
jgi:acyl carrier protein